MSFEYLLEKENKVKKLSKPEQSELAQQIASDYERYNKAWFNNRQMANELEKEIFFNKESLSTNKEERWKTKINMAKAFMFYQTLKAFIWKNVYSSINSMFDVSGENSDSDSTSSKQKSFLVDVFEKMNISNTLDDIVDYAMIYGSFTAFCGWKKKEEQYRRSINFFKALFKEDIQNLPKIANAIKNGENVYVDTRVVYDNPYVIPVNPAQLVFDVTQKTNWDECPKIFKSYKVPDDIINNQYYEIDKDTAKEIKDLVISAGDKQEDLQNQTSEDLTDEVVNGSTVEVLEHWGNLKLKDGALLKNWHCVVVARKYVVRFKDNFRLINPFIYHDLIEDPKTKRGISPLYCILELAKTQEDLFNRTCDMQALAENPPILAPKGFLKGDEIKLYPGKVIEYGDNLDIKNLFKQLDFNVSIFLNDIAFLNDLMAEISGIFPNMVGADEQKAKTATEISTKTNGQMTRLSMIIDSINQYLIVPMVKNVAKLCADFKIGEIDKIYINKDDKKEEIAIDDTVRQGNYKYTYSDRTVTAEKSGKADLVVQACREFAKFLPLNAQEVFTWYLEQKDVENPKRFIDEQAQIPQEVQSLLLKQPEIQELISNVEQMKQAGINPNEEEQDNTMVQAQQGMINEQ